MAYRVRVAPSIRGAYWLSLLTAVHASGDWPVFWLFWVVPLLTAYPLYLQLREIAHHSNAPDNGDLANSRVFRVHPLLSAVIFPYGQAFHLTHHLFALVPHYRIAQAHAILGRHRPYRESVTVCQGFFFRRIGAGGPSVLDLLSSRKIAGGKSADRTRVDQAETPRPTALGAATPVHRAHLPASPIGYSEG